MCRSGAPRRARSSSGQHNMCSVRVGGLTVQMTFAVDPPEEVWTHPAVHVGYSTIAGKGLLTSAPLETGTVVVRLGGRRVTTAELHALFDSASAAASNDYVDTFAVSHDTHLVLPTQTAAHYANHSCDPTMWLVSPFELATCRRVVAGEELTVDYGLISDDDEFRMECGCRSSRCRDVITGADWRRVDLQTRYEGHWPLGLRRRIEGQNPPD